MPIVGYSIRSISANRKDVPKGRININSNPKIVSVKEAEVGFSRKEKSIKVGFEFLTRYEPNIGKIIIVGDVLYTGKKLSESLKKWEKSEKLPKEVEMEIKNFLFRKCLSLGISLSENMQLPPPLIFPRVVTKKKEVDLKYIG